MKEKKCTLNFREEKIDFRQNTFFRIQPQVQLLSLSVCLSVSVSVSVSVSLSLSLSLSLSPSKKSSFIIRNINEYLPWEDVVCVELHGVAFRNGGMCEMRRPRYQALFITYFQKCYPLISVIYSNFIHSFAMRVHFP